MVASLVLCSACAAVVQAGNSESFAASSSAGTPDGLTCLAGQEAMRFEEASLEYPGLAPSKGGLVVFDHSKKIDRPIFAMIEGLEIPEPGSNGEIFYSLLMDVRSVGKLSSEGGHSGLLMLGTREAGMKFGGKAQAAVGLKSAGPDAVIFTISSAHHGARGTSTAVGSSHATKTTHLLVVRHATQNGKATATLWVNPKPGTPPESNPSTTAEIDPHATPKFDALIIGAQTSLVSTPEIFAIDEIRVGQTWADVVPEG